MMSQFGELMALCLQEREERNRGGGGGGGAAVTIFELLSERRMDGGVDRLRRRKSLQERLGLKGIVCCGSTWGFGPSTMSTRADDDDDNDDEAADDFSDPLRQHIDGVTDVSRTPPERIPDPDCVTASPRMNLAAALAAERHFRSAAETGAESLTSPNNQNETFNNNNNNDNNNTPSRLIATMANGTPPRGSTVDPGTPARVSLMRLLEESDGQDEKDKDGGGVGMDPVCCVCMGRKKGAAFIPCGHTFCRVCSRELWLNRGSCPLCNRSILEILDIY